MRWWKTLPLLFTFALADNKSLFDLDSSQLIDSECCDLTYAQINHLNHRIRPKIARLVQEDYFKHYLFQLDLQCPFFDCQSICFSPGCQLDLDVHSDEYDYDLLNEKGDKLGDLSEDSFLDSLCPPEKEDDDNEWCDLNDKDGVIIDISRNPERFTGYIPTPEQNIWSMIYQNQIEGECKIEQKVFYQIISGFHSSVSTHLSNEWYNKETDSWVPNLELFKFKVGDHKDRLANIYFNYALLTRAIIKFAPFLKQHKFNPLHAQNDKDIHNQLKSIIDELPSSLNIFNEDLMFENHAIKEEFKTKFKNVTRLMDCVTCDRCRLWGKIQSTGYATALKILFTDNAEVLHDISKNEIASLFNTFDRLTKSINAINFFNYLDLKNKTEQATVEEHNIEEVDEQADDSIAEKVKSKNQNEKTLGEKFNAELDEVVNALKFIWSSYINLPHNLKNILLYKMNQWWDSYMGLKPRDKTEYLHNIKV